MEKFKINDDQWQNAGQTYQLLEYNRRQDSSAVVVKYLTEDGTEGEQTVAFHFIEWVE
jgi:hypothetical protein